MDKMGNTQRDMEIQEAGKNLYDAAVANVIVFYAQGEKNPKPHLKHFQNSVSEGVNFL